MEISKKIRCSFCASDKRIVLPSVGISLGMWGEDFTFCSHCLTNMNARKLFKTLFRNYGLKWPPREGQNGKSAI